MHGAVLRKTGDDCAFKLRHQGFSFRILCYFKEATARGPAVAWAKSFAAALEPFSGGKIYYDAPLLVGQVPRQQEKPRRTASRPPSSSIPTNTPIWLS